MSTATIVALSGIREQQQQRRSRERLHEQFDNWLNHLENAMKQAKPTIVELTQAVLKMREELTQAVTADLIERKYAALLGQKAAECPSCGATLTARGPLARTIGTLAGEVELRRPYFYCPACHYGFYPLDQALGLTDSHTQLDMQQALAVLTKEVPYTTACELFTQLTGRPVGEHLAHTITNAMTAGLTVLDVAKTAADIKQLVAEVAVGKKWRPIMVLAIDGADVPTRPESAKGKRKGRKNSRAHRAHWQGEWREAKGFRFYLVAEERIVHVLSWHQVQSDDELAASLQQVKDANLIPEELVRLCVIADGARWIWNHVSRLFPGAVEILDYFHCTEHLGKVAVLQYADNPERQHEWLEATLARLFSDQVHGVIWGLQRMQPRDEQTEQEIRKLIGYLQEHLERVRYQFFRKGGYPIGSGGIESANKFICHVRLKRSGAWWYVTNANQMLALRCAKYNGTLDRVFRRYQRLVQEIP